MTQEKRHLLLATLAVASLFAGYETAKTLLFPAMSIITSHIVSTVVVGIMTIFMARSVIRRQMHLLREREQSNTRLREALAAAERNGNLLESIVASIDEGLVITDGDSRVLLANSAARALLGLGARATERLTDISRDPQVHRAFAEVLSTGARAEARVETGLGYQGSKDRRILRLHAAPLRLGGTNVDGVVGAFIDITQLERLERIRQEFLTNVSHELRTPLASITAYIETLLNGGLDDNENRMRFLLTVQRNAERMRDLVSDISELSAIESGAVRLALERLPLRQVVDEVFIGLAPRGKKQGVQLHNQVAVSYMVTADHRRLEQILTNLVDNAIKFNRPGGEVIVTADLSDDGDYHLIKVRDTGPGIAPEHLLRVFERFYRVDKARSRDVGGTGLGLAIVKHLARAHGGEAFVTSDPGAGCEFVIKLPIHEANASRQKETPSDQSAITTAASSPHPVISSK
jgi:two-component system phosphate regulon sensor histidine kinase PhoR